MGKPISIQNSVGNRVTAVHLVLFAVMLPFDRFYTELILISLAIHTIVQSPNLPGINKLNRPILLVSSVYLVNLVSLIYTRDQTEGTSEIIKQLALLVIPVLFFVNPAPIRKYRDVILHAFAYACTGTIIYLYYDAIHTIHFYHLPGRILFSQTFMNHNFSLPLELHATYLSMYAALSFIFLFDRFLKRHSRRKKGFYLFCLVVLFCGLLQLASRTVFLYFLGFNTLVVPFVYFKGRSRFLAFTGFFILSVIIILVLLQSASFEERYVAGIRSDLSFSADPNHNSDPRAERWALAMHLVREAPFLGHGAGSERRILADSYFKHKLYDSFLHQLNAHNQYLSFWLKNGLFGFCIYLFSLGIGLRYAFQRKQYLLLAFLLLIVSVSFTENILDVNKGIFFYSFFFSLFLTSEEVCNSNFSERQPSLKRKRLYSIIEHH